mmetsp:Transcript_15567/g.32995  ORF Transcript_15567/g.32995 Transcript_15567/m.32995 type:complete len:99 (+) Transcript_15567:956-1252(+)
MRPRTGVERTPIAPPRKMKPTRSPSTTKRRNPFATSRRSLPSTNDLKLSFKARKLAEAERYSLFAATAAEDLGTTARGAATCCDSVGEAASPAADAGS